MRSRDSTINNNCLLFDKAHRQKLLLSHKVLPDFVLACGPAIHMVRCAAVRLALRVPSAAFRLRHRFDKKVNGKPVRHFRPALTTSALIFSAENEDEQSQ